MPDSVSSGKPYIMTGDMFEKASMIDFENCKQVSEEDYLKLSRKIKPNTGDIIFARYATIGTVCYVDIEKDFLVSYACVTIKPNHQKIIGKYLFYFFKSNFFLEEIKNHINSNTQGNVGVDSLYRTRLVVPPLEEQLQIVEYIENELNQIDKLIEKTTKEIELIKEYKTSLINEAVSGKIKVC
jgi:type I restriction enzyme S subunit